MGSGQAALSTVRPVPPRCTVSSPRGDSRARHAFSAWSGHHPVSRAGPARRPYSRRDGFRRSTGRVLARRLKRATPPSPATPKARAGPQLVCPDRRGHSGRIDISKCRRSGRAPDAAVSENGAAAASSRLSSSAPGPVRRRRDTQHRSAPLGEGRLDGDDTERGPSARVLYATARVHSDSRHRIPCAGAVLPGGVGGDPTPAQPRLSSAPAPRRTAPIMGKLTRQMPPGAGSAAQEMTTGSKTPRGRKGPSTAAALWRATSRRWARRHAIRSVKPFIGMPQLRMVRGKYAQHA